MPRFNNNFFWSIISTGLIPISIELTVFAKKLPFLSTISALFNLL